MPEPSETVINYLIQDPTPQAPAAQAQASVSDAPWSGVPAPKIDEWGQLPVQAGTFEHVDSLFYFTYVVCIFFFVLITGVLLYSVVAHRRKTWDQKPLSNVTHNTPLEVVWTVIPLIIVMIMFAWGFKGSLDMTTIPHDAQRNTYKATAQQWKWVFTHPNDAAGESTGEVWMVVNKPAQFVLNSMDVLHAFYVPSMRVKRDIVPGRYQSVWFEPILKGDFHLFCAEYCGDSHSRMYATVHVVSQEEYDKRPWDTFDDSTPELAIQSGEKIYRRNCLTCHSLDGTPNTGPSWQGLFTKNSDGSYQGRQREVIEEGEKKTITVTDSYITESILKPNQKIVAEAPYNSGGMAVQNLNERQINAVILFMKSLAAN
jgi:cytochrome c oxidase subunit II